MGVRSLRSSKRQPIEKALGIRFGGEELYVWAFTHRSFAYENGGLPTNERLEFLGDAVLGLVVTDIIYRAFPDLPEGQLAKLRAATVNMNVLAEVARELGVGDAVRLGRGEELSGGRDKSSILADTLEAVLGAIYLDKGLSRAAALVRRLFEHRVMEAAGRGRRPRLQDLAPGAGRLQPRRDALLRDRGGGPRPRQALHGHRLGRRHRLRQRQGALQEGGRAAGGPGGVRVAGHRPHGHRHRRRRRSKSGAAARPPAG